MNRRIFILTTMIAVAILLPEMGFATDRLGGKLDTEISDLKDTLFGFPKIIAGILAAFYGVVQCFATGSHKPLMMWGGIALITFFIPKVLETLFGLPVGVPTP